MASPLDNWSPENKATCFRRFVQFVKQQHKDVFLRDGHHAEMFFFVTDDGTVEVMPAPANMDRDQTVEMLKRKVQENNAYGFVHIAESWGYFRRKPGDHTMRQIAEGEIKVSELRPEDRDEVLVVTMESREGAHFMWITPILRDGDQVSLGKTIAFSESPGGRFAGIFMQ